jgi:limonene-1,2-epoxide hydrolase
VVKRNKEIHGLTKPTAENPDAERMREKRAAERADLLAAYAGQSSATLKAEQVENYKVATPESIAKAKALDKAIKVVERAEKETRKGSLEVLRKSAQDQFKACLSVLVERGDERALTDLIVLLKRLPDDFAKRGASVQ